MNAVTVGMPPPPPGKMWHDPEYDALWSTCVDLDVPVSLHGVNAVGPDVRERYNHIPGIFVALTHVIGNSLEDMMSPGPLHLLRDPGAPPGAPHIGPGGERRLGALARPPHGRPHPRAARSSSPTTKCWPSSPASFFFRQCFVACDADEGSLKYAADYTDGERIIWNTDYPHPDAPDPDKALDYLLEQPISDDHKRKILWDNPVALYGQRILA